MDIDIIIFLLFINIISFFVGAYDKFLAKKNKFRISEKILILLSILGGCFGINLVITCFNHKKKVKKIRKCVYFSQIIWLFLLICTFI